MTLLLFGETPDGNLVLQVRVLQMFHGNSLVKKTKGFCPEWCNSREHLL